MAANDQPRSIVITAHRDIVFGFVFRITFESLTIVKKNFKEYIVKDGKLKRIENRIAMDYEINDLLEELYSVCKEFNYQFSNVFKIENRSETPFGIEFMPKDGLYIFEKDEKKLTPYTPELTYGPHLEDCQEDLVDNCQTFYGFFHNVRHCSKPTFFMDLKISDITFHQRYTSSSFGLFETMTYLESTPKSFQKLLTMFCFTNSVPDGSLLVFADMLDDLSSLRKYLPRKVKLDLKNGKVDFLEMFQ